MADTEDIKKFMLIKRTIQVSVWTMVLVGIIMLLILAGVIVLMVYLIWQRPIVTHSS